VETAGSPAHHLTDTLVEKYSTNPIVQEAVRRKLVAVKSELAGPDPTPLEQLLAERASICWLQVNRYENGYELAEEMTIRQAEFHQNKIDAAHRRFLSTVRTLAQIRKLGLPAVQINVGTNQVNVA
jgi:hypothetical protein